MSEEKQTMSIKEAIRTAIKLEAAVKNVYVVATEESRDATGKRVFGILAKEEQHHLDYLKERLEELQEDGKIQVKKVGTKIPSKETINNMVNDLKKALEPKKMDYELALLRKAVEVEQQTSDFYRKMSEEMDGDAQNMFKEFLEIEDSHLAIVQAEYDAVSGVGFFFGMEEFNMEAG